MLNGVATMCDVFVVSLNMNESVGAGVKVTARNFGRDRRYPITTLFRDGGEPLPRADESLVARGGRASIDAFEG